jgi:hypothetical protein
MISAARILGLGAACAILFATGQGVEPANAQPACKNDVISATGRGKIAIRRQRQLEGGGSAMRDAVASWQREAESRFGDEFKNWDRAKDAKFDCSPSGTFTVQCTISGKPCHSSAERREPDRVEIRDRDDDRRGERTRRNRISEARRGDRDDDRYDRRRRTSRDDYIEHYGYGFLNEQYLEDDENDRRYGRNRYGYSGHRHHRHHDHYGRRHYGHHHHWRWGYSRNYCSEAQYFLQACGYYVTQDGVCGEETAGAIASFQRRNGLYPTGQANAWTREVLIRRCVR